MYKLRNVINEYEKYVYNLCKCFNDTSYVTKRKSCSTITNGDKIKGADRKNDEKSILGFNKGRSKI